MMNVDLNRIACDISEGYLKTVCAFSDIALSPSGRDFDNMGIDGSIRKMVRTKNLNGMGHHLLPVGRNIEFQLKSCYGEESMFRQSADCVEYNIGTEFFDRLRYIEGAVILIVFRLPSKSDFDDWVQIQEDYTKIQKCAYFREVIHTDRTSWVKIPKTSLLIPDNLNKLFEKPKKL